MIRKRFVLALAACLLLAPAGAARAQEFLFGVQSADTAGGVALSPSSLYTHHVDGSVLAFYNGGTDAPLDAAAYLPDTGDLALSAQGPCPCTVFGIPNVAASDIVVKNIVANTAAAVAIPASTFGLAGEDLDALGVFGGGAQIAFSVRADGGTIGGGSYPTIQNAENAAVYIGDLVNQLGVLVDFTNDFADGVAAGGANLDSVAFLGSTGSILVSFDVAQDGAETLEGFAIHDEDVFAVDVQNKAVSLYFDGSAGANWSGGDALDADIRCVQLPLNNPSDADGDGVANDVDNCENVPNPEQENLDEDGQGDACDPDIDGDGAPNAQDNCDRLANAGQEDLDQDGAGDVCDADRDGDGIPEDGDDDGLILSPSCKPGEMQGCDDNCPIESNPGQEDQDGDGIGDPCEFADPDEDGVLNVPPFFVDNCPETANPDQADGDGNGVGDACENLVCGNGLLQAGEECDDGNVVSEDGCSAECRIEFCGDGVVQDPGEVEECDDGNTAAEDGCSPDCKLENCGDGVLDPFEQCDDGNNADGDGCSARCRVETAVCGDGKLQFGEECDDGNLVNEDGCSAECRIEFCGDGTVQDPGEVEECDDGNNLPGDGCSPNCTLENCGDGFLNPFEECDDGNNQDGDGCSARCRLESDLCECRDGDRDGYFVLVGECAESGLKHGRFNPICGWEDCNDADPAIHPFGKEIWGNGVDENCNGAVSCASSPDAGGPAAALALLPLAAMLLRRRRA